MPMPIPKYKPRNGGRLASGHGHGGARGGRGRGGAYGGSGGRGVAQANVFGNAMSIPQYDLQHSSSQNTRPIYAQMDYYDYDFASISNSNSAIQSFNHRTPTTTTTTRPPCTSGKLTMYEKTYFRGQPTVIESDHIQDFASFPDLIDDKLASINVEGNCCWRIYEGKNFSGINMWLSPKEYKSATNIMSIYKKASSAKMFQC